MDETLQDSHRECDSISPIGHRGGWAKGTWKGNRQDARGPTGHPPLISRLLALVHTVINEREKGLCTSNNIDRALHLIW